ncbi:FecCD family ABC transporter permease [Leucobacter luti]|uniref:FecCD family ABC transporter permease n=1 Tax=Leucobacter luti TaxID=340320 RepID=UPI003D06ED92
MTVVGAADERAAAVLPGARAHRRGLLWVGLLAVGTVASIVVSVGLGSASISPDTTVRVIWHHLTGLGAVTWTTSEDNIVWLLRLPRVLLGVLVGATLSVAGVAIQALVRNILADPYLLGISSGASTGAAASILFGFGSGLGVAALTGSAFLGALGAIILVFAMARVGGRMISARLVFAGIAVGFALTAATNFMVFVSDSQNGARAVLFWMLGSLGQAQWSSLPVLAAITVPVTVILTAWSRRLDAISIGDDTARVLGTDPTRFRAIAVLVTALAVAAAVAVSGMIGFVGLVIPHLVRHLVGARHVAVIPCSALLGALLIVWADVLARAAFAPRELPLGILTALIGTPLLIMLVRRMMAR